MAVELEVLGWDNGYGYEKFFTVTNSRKYREETLTEEEEKMGLTKEEKKMGIKKCRFPSMHLEVTAAGSLSISFAHKYSYDKMNLMFKDKEYLIGNYSIQQERGIKNYNQFKYKDDTEVVKLCAGLALMFPIDEKIIIKNLIIGTSLRTLQKNYIKEAIDTYKNKRIEFTYPAQIATGEIRRKNVEVIIENVQFIPQGIGTVHDIIFTIDGRLEERQDNINLFEQRYGIIDIGTNTVDGFIREGFNTHMQGSEFFMNYGVSDVYKNAARKLNLEHKYNQIELLHLSGKEYIFNYGNNIYFIDAVMEEYELFAENLYSMTIDPWNRYLETVQVIILAGGCASLVKNSLAKKFSPIPIYVPTDPQFSNARGYYKYGSFLSRSEG